MSSSFEGLPHEIVLSICRYVGDTHKASLSALALTSKRCHAAAVVYLFRTVRLNARHLERFRNDAQKCTDVLERTQSFGTVHRLVVEDSMLELDQQAGAATFVIGNMGQQRRRVETVMGLDDDISADQLEKTAWRKEFRTDRRHAWNTLASMIEQLPALSDLIYECSIQIAPCILKVLHQYRPQCKLHIKPFGLRSLDATNMDAHDFALATSPCLHSISVKYASAVEDREEAVLRLAAGLAPKLLLASPAIGFPVDDANYVGGFIRSLPSLTTLKLEDEVRRDDFETILRYHGASLRKLCLSPCGRINQISITPQEIVQIRESCPQLENLSLTVRRFRGDAEEVAVYRALGTLSGVQKLSLTLDAFEPSVDVVDCIEDKSYDWDDFDRKLSDYRSPPSFAFLPNGHFRLAFINRALDEKLARAIYQSISSTRKGGALPLRKLKLSMTGHGIITALGSSTIQDVFEEIGRSWLLVPHPRDDCPNELLVQEPQRQKRARMRRRPIAEDLEVIFRKIWPENRKEGGNWRDDWHSLTLRISHP